jgi:hypothetical protein
MGGLRRKDDYATSRLLFLIFSSDWSFEYITFTRGKHVRLGRGVSHFAVHSASHALANFAANA